MVFAALAGRISVLPGLPVGAIILILLAESPRIFFGTGSLGRDNLVYGTLLVLFIILLPRDPVGAARTRHTGARRTA